MIAVFKREFRTYFTSPIGYVVLALLFGFSGYLFFVANLRYGQTSMASVYGSLLSIVLLLILPVLTMRLFSDEKRQKTDQALLTAPVSLGGIALGKFFAALLIYLIGISITLVYALVIAFQVAPDWMAILGNYLGLALLGGMVISIGMLLSCLTESQFVAALLTFIVSYVMMLVDGLTSVFSGNTIVSSIVDFLSVTTRYNSFTAGVIHYDDVIFFLSLQALFIFLTVRVLDRKRWN